MGAYWLYPSSSARDTAARNAGGVARSGNPCAMLRAPHSAAKADISVKMVVPTLGIFERGRRGDFMLNG